MSNSTDTNSATSSGGILSGLNPVSPGGRLQVSGSPAEVDASSHSVIIDNISYGVSSVVSALVKAVDRSNNKLIPSDGYSLVLGSEVVKEGGSITVSVMANNDGPEAATIIAFSDGGAGGAFTPATASIPANGTASVSVQYQAPSTAGTVQISSTNSVGLTDPSAQAITVQSAVVPSFSDYTVGLPIASVQTSGVTAVTVTPGSGSAHTSDLTITLSDNGAGGSFSTNPVTIPAGSVAAVSCNYTAPPTAGTVKISSTNNGSLTDPAMLTAAVSAVVNPLSFATVNGIIGNVMESRGTREAFRWSHIIGSDNLTSIVAMFDNWTGWGGNPGNTLPIVDCSLEYNNQVVPLTFSGLRSITLADGANDVHSDEVLASAFGVASFAKGATIYIKGRIEFADDATATQVIFNTSRGTNSGDQIIWYTGTLSSTDVVGPYTVTSGTSSTRVNGYYPTLLGRYEGSSVPVILMHGDSITSGAHGDAYNLIGAGWQGTALVDSDGASDPISYYRASVFGSVTTTAFDPRYAQLYKYATLGFIQYGTNDIGAAGTGDFDAISANITTLATNMKTLGGSRIERTMGAGLPPRTTSTDGWETYANQTITGPGWAAGATAAELTAWVMSGGGGIFFNGVQWNSVRDPDDSTLWLVNGTGNYTAGDGTHPSTSGYVLMGEEARQPILDLIAGTLSVFSKYAISGNADLTEGLASIFTITPGSGSALTEDVVITPVSSVAGAFAPETVTIPKGSTAAVQFSFTPSAVGSGTISTTNNAGLTDPAALAINVVEYVATTDYTMTGPTALTVGATAQFKIVQGAGSLDSPVVITPKSTIAGTFSPSSVKLPIGSGASEEFSFIPSAAGSGTVSSVNTASLTDPEALDVTVTTAGSNYLTTPADGTGGCTSTTAMQTTSSVLDAVISLKAASVSGGGNSVRYPLLGDNSQGSKYGKFGINIQGVTSDLYMCVTDGATASTTWWGACPSAANGLLIRGAANVGSTQQTLFDGTTLSANRGRMWTSADNGTTWTALGAEQAISGIAKFNAADAATKPSVMLGTPIAAEVFSGVIRDGSGAKIMNVDFTNVPAGSTTFTGADGMTYNVSSGSTISNSQITPAL